MASAFSKIPYQSTKIKTKKISLVQKYYGSFATRLSGKTFKIA